MFEFSFFYNYIITVKLLVILLFLKGYMFHSHELSFFLFFFSLLEASFSAASKVFFTFVFKTGKITIRKFLRRD